MRACGLGHDDFVIALAIAVACEAMATAYFRRAARR